MGKWAGTIHAALSRALACCIHRFTCPDAPHDCDGQNTTSAPWIASARVISGE